MHQKMFNILYIYACMHAAELIYITMSLLVYVCILWPLCSFLYFFPSLLDYEARTFDLTFSRTINQVNIRIPILNDTNVEGSEHFFGTLQDQGTPVTVIASPDTATVFITEDPSDSKSKRKKQ